MSGCINFFITFAAQFKKSCLCMNHILIAEPIEISYPVVRNWGYLENWKSTASSEVHL